MDKILLKIYEKVIIEEKCAQEGQKREEAYIAELVQKYAADHGQEETESIRSLAYAAALKAEQEGFQLGVQFAIRLLLELYPRL